MRKLVFIIVVAAAVATASAAIKTVGPSGSGADFNSIAAATFAISAGDEIRVRSDFAETVGYVLCDKDMTIASYDSSWAIKQPGAAMNGGVDVSCASGPNIVLDGMVCDLTATGRANVAMFGGAGRLTFQNRCDVKGNDHGLLVFAGANGSTVTVTDSRISGALHAMTVDVPMALIATNSQFGPAGWDGIMINDFAELTHMDITMTSCVVTGAGFGMILGKPTTLTMSNNCEVRDNRIHGIEFRANSGGSVLTISNSQIVRNGVDTGDPWWGTGLSVISNIGVTLTDVAIKNNRMDGIFCFDAAANASMTLANSDVSSNRRNGFNTDVKLGNVSIQQCKFNDNLGTGMTNNANANGINYGTISHCEFNRNTNDGVNFLRQTLATFTNCQMKGNGYGGIVKMTDNNGNPGLVSTLTVQDCDLEGNGRSLAINDSAQTWNVTRCKLGNSATMDAIMANNPTTNTMTVTVKRCSIKDSGANSAPLIIAANAGTPAAPLSFENCVFDGGSIMVDSNGSNLEFKYCTLATKADNPGTAFHAYDSAPDLPMAVTLTKSIVTGQQTAAQVDAGGVFTNDNSLINGTLIGAVLGPGSFTGDPKFVNRADGDFNLTPPSDAVRKVAFTAGDVDYNGTLRPLPASASLADMGAYEIDESTGVADWMCF
ncbi:MAG: right-handed parallel beta-helix repeat-containing protein [Candidatus Sumerlaeota bacterium]|nr:right-handed parallel beta-helix repeat-containing protein [Candidatus Sumerlaeota bacterium]